MRKFKAPKKTFGDLDATTIAHLVSASSDLALVLDRKGVIRDLSFENDEFADYGCGEWVGRPWLDVVTLESQAKVTEMLDDARAGGVSNWRQINHPGLHNIDLPVRYSAFGLPSTDRILAIGRDLRPVSALQQRLVSAQAQMEQEYARLRFAETRYQTLFQLSTEAVIVLDAASQKIVETNPAASHLLDAGTQPLIGRRFSELLDDEGALSAQMLFAKLRTSPRADDIVIRVPGADQDFSLSASIFRNDSATHYLLRFSPVNGASLRTNGRTSPCDPVADIIAQMPDGFVVMGEDRQIVSANAAFLQLSQLADEEQARGQRIERWLGRVDVDVDVLIANLREYGFLRRFPTIIRGEFGGKEEIELSGVAVGGQDKPCYGLTIRKLQSVNGTVGTQRQITPRSLEQLKELVGRVPLRDLVRETTDIVEQMCIEAALELTGDNRASAAEMLGLSRQSLYVKLRRHGLGELDSQESH